MSYMKYGIVVSIAALMLATAAYAIMPNTGTVAAYSIPMECAEIAEGDARQLSCVIELEKAREREFLSAFTKADAFNKHIMRSMVMEAATRCRARDSAIQRSLCFGSTYYDATEVVFPVRWE